MSAKAFLDGARRAERQLRALMDRRRFCDEVARQAGGAGPGLAALQGELQRRAEAWAAEQLRVAQAIDRVADPLAREVLRYRYLDGLDWREIAARMCYSRDWLWKVHRRAVEELERSWAE